MEKEKPEIAELQKTSRALPQAKKTVVENYVKSFRRTGNRKFKLNLDFVLLRDLREKNNLTTIAEVVKIDDDDTFFCVYDSLLLLIRSNLFDLLSLSQPATTEQIDECVLLIIRDHPNLSPEDLKLFCMMAIKGDFGENYGRLDPPMFGRWLAAFEERRRDDNRKAWKNEAKKQELQEKEAFWNRYKNDSDFRKEIEAARAETLETMRRVAAEAENGSLGAAIAQTEFLDD